MISEGGRPASTRMGVTLRRASHHGQARNTFSSFLFRVLPFPASRPMSSGHFMCMALSPTKKIPDWSLRWSRKHAEVRSGGHSWPMLAAQRVPGRPRSGVFGRPWGPSGQEAQRNRTETCAKRYAQCGLGDTCLPKHRNYCIFLTCNKNAKMGPEVRREKRYAQCLFVDMRALKRFMLDHVRLVFFNFAKPKTIDANMKSLKNHRKMNEHRIHVIFVNFVGSQLLKHVDVISKP